MAAAPGPTSWDDFRLIAAVAAGRSLPAAAAALGIDHSTVFRRLNQIEAALGVKLFERARSGYTPTPAGEEIVAAAERLGAEITALTRRLAGRAPEPDGEVRLTTNDTLLVHLLTPMLARFRLRQPRIRLDVVVDNRALNLTKRDADVALRATDAPPDTLIGRRLARLRWALYGLGGGFPEPGPVAAAALDGQNWVAPGDGLGGLAAGRHVRGRVAAERIVYRVDTVLGLAEAIEAGIGIGYLPCFVGDARPALRRLEAPREAFATDLWLLTHADLRHAARVRAFLDFIAEEIAAARPLIEGDRAASGSETLGG